MANAMAEPTSELLYLEDLHVGRRFTSRTHSLDERQITAFASEFDPQPFHTDREAAKETLFRGLAASGWHTAAITRKRARGRRAVALAAGPRNGHGAERNPQPARRSGIDCHGQAARSRRSRMDG